MVSIEKTAKTAEDAIQLALAELGVPREQAEIEILEESKSLFGILGTSHARVRVTAEPPATAEPAPQRMTREPVRERTTVRPPGDGTVGERAARMLTEMLKLMGIAAAAHIIEEDEEQVLLDIRGEELGLLIGKHGQTLAAVQHLVGLMANRGEEVRRRIILDAEGYRERREESLRHLAIASARKALQTGQSVTLDYMLPHERRIIHSALADDPDITTYSIGDDPARHIVIEPRAGAGYSPSAADQEDAPPADEPEAEDLAGEGRDQ